MRQITEVLRVAGQGPSYRQIAQSVGIAASTVHGYLDRAQRAGLSLAAARRPRRCRS
jgi:transposase